MGDGLRGCARRVAGAGRTGDQGIALSRLLLAAITAAVAVLVSCAPQIRQFYPDAFYVADNIYDNKTLGFALRFTGTWRVVTDPNKMNKAVRKAAQSLQASQAELLFHAYTVEGTQGARGIVENSNLSDEEYLATVRKANTGSVDKDLGDTLFSAGGRLMIKWEYQYAGLQYAEFIFKSGTYNVRLAFWTTPELFARFLPVYEDIMSTINFANAQIY